MSHERVQLAARIRYLARADIRQAREQALIKLLLGGDVAPSAIEPVGRQIQRARFLHRDDLAGQLGQNTSATKKLYEAIITPNEMLPRRFLDRGVAAAKAVGRIAVRLPNGQERFGTGSLVSGHHVLTNNHVLPSADDAANAVIELGYYAANSSATPGVPQTFRVRPDDFFYTCEELDFTLSGIEPQNGQASTSDYGRLELLAESGKALIGEKVNIIQHPGGQPQTITIRANQVVDVVDQFIHYAADTAPGSSGSPVFNDEWQLVGIHHASVAVDSPSGGIVNEGIRTSAIVQTLGDALR